MFNFSGSEIVFLLLLALIILGPEKLPEAIRTFGKTYAEFKKVTTGFQSELKSALDEPMREMRETADLFKSAATFDGVADMLDDAKKVVAEAANPTASPTSAPESVAVDPADAAAAAPPLASAETSGPADSAADAAPVVAPAAAASAPTVESAMVQRMRSLDDIVTRDEPVERPAGPAFHSAAPPVRTAPADEPTAATDDAPADQPADAPADQPADGPEQAGA